ncbi:AraC family transcriptional regulator [Spongiactinospora rosea]|uniref:AraC family transcriptional regulator n=1 Tax=Spongiactinospora rosea TaxID=2248750 RepID=A0A366LU52_9ACTN|nr:helix-turn-helix domain-containing protein [Spongiactinospora rosea]RBQ17461.1 AraC family transcriptional regulator [Spongiactinospora rosea]
MPAPDGLTALEGTPGPALRRHVTQFTAYREDHPVPLHRRQPPFGGVVLIIGFTERLGLRDPRRPGSPHRLASFTGGLADTYTDMVTQGSAEGVQVNLTPMGARRIFGVPMSELANRIVPLGDVLGRWGEELVERLADAPDRPVRLALLDRLLTRRLAAAPEPGPQIPWAWDRLLATHGSMGVGELADRLGWSHRHLLARFRDQVGLPPKAAARVLRFDHALRRLTSPAGPAASLAEVAAEAGYFDQAHMNRDFRAMAGSAPARLLATHRADGFAVPEADG